MRVYLLVFLLHPLCLVFSQEEEQDAGIQLHFHLTQSLDEVEQANETNEPETPGLYNRRFFPGDLNIKECSL